MGKGVRMVKKGLTREALQKEAGFFAAIKEAVKESPVRPCRK